MTRAAVRAHATSRTETKLRGHRGDPGLLEMLLAEVRHKRSVRIGLALWVACVAAAFAAVEVSAPGMLAVWVLVALLAVTVVAFVLGDRASRAVRRSARQRARSTARVAGRARHGHRASRRAS